MGRNSNLPNLDVDVNEVAAFKSPRTTRLGRILHAVEKYGKNFAITYASKHVPKKNFANAKRSIDKHIASKPDLAKRENQMEQARIARKKGKTGYTKSKTELAKEKAAAYKKKSKSKAFANRSQKADPNALTFAERMAGGRKKTGSGIDLDQVKKDVGNQKQNINIKGDGNSKIGNNYSTNNGGSRPVVSQPVSKPPGNNTPPTVKRTAGFGNYEEWKKNRFSARTTDFQDSDRDGVDDRDQAGPGKPRFRVKGSTVPENNRGNGSNADNNQKPSGNTPTRYRPSSAAQEFKDLYSSQLNVAKVGNKYQNIDINGNNNSNIGNDYSVNISSKKGKGLNNMQSAMAYIGLNDNRSAKDSAQFNPYSTAYQTMKTVDDTAGKGVDRRGYNVVGMTANYFGDKSKKQDNFTLGDVWKFKAPEYVVPESDKDIFEKYQY